MATMFTPHDLAEAIEQARDETILQPETSPLMVQKHPGGYEDIFWLFRGAKAEFRDSAHFWFSCIIRQCAYLGPHPEKVHRVLDSVEKDLPQQYEEISPETFHAIIQQYSGWLTDSNIPHVYEWSGKIGRAMRMSDEWNDVAVIGETASEFVAFRWVTSA